MRNLPFLRFITLLPFVGLMLVCCSENSDQPTVGDEIPEMIIIEGCDSERQKRIIWAIRYSRAAAKSNKFEQLLSQGVEDQLPLYTHQESSWVGPYFACQGVLGSEIKDPEFVMQSPTLAYGAALSVALKHVRPLIIQCGGTSATAESFSKFEFFASGSEDNPARIALGERVFSQYPNHQEGWNINEKFGNLGPSYPIDELAGIILHERLHTRGFEHGNDNNQCQYTFGFDCPETGEPSTCRMNSLNEIAEAAMSEVVEESIGWCDNWKEECSEGQVKILVSRSLVDQENVICECISWK